MKQVIHENGEVPIKLWTDDIDDNALQQLHNVAKLPFVHSHGIAAMPDVHWGIGATVGSVIPTKGAIIPAAVGVDIGCGMMAVKTSLRANDLPESLTRLRAQIERDVPLGAGGHHRAIAQVNKLAAYMPPFQGCPVVPVPGSPEKACAQLGTLGSGNHFIEVCLDQNKDVWVMLHSGSRGIGNQVGRYYIEQARELARRYFINLPDRDLAFLPEQTPEFEDYVRAVHWCQDYAAKNREVMMRAVLAAMVQCITRPFHTGMLAVNCHHNYVAMEHHYGDNVWVTRKGAIRARQGDLGIIPGSMGARSYIVNGKGNAHSYDSCAHGAGRKYGRKEAMRRFTVEDLKAQTEGVECRKDAAVLDELPSAYKPIDEVMANQADLVEVLFELKQVLCVKGA
jgi:tRNA-splicing ligase RtcB